MVIATGTPEQVARHKASFTGQHIRKVLPAALANAV
jgi:excinuclease UvrABC ATPase subunit